MKEVRNEINFLPFTILSVASKRVLDCIDFASVITCVWMVFWLIYLNFVKDFIEILAYATCKYVNRLRWVYRVLKINILLKPIDEFLETCELNWSTKTDHSPPKETMTSENIYGNISVNSSTSEQLSNVQDCTPRSSKNKLDINPRCIDFIEESGSAGKNSSSPEANATLVEEIHVLECPVKNSVAHTDDDAINAINSLEEKVICSTAEHIIDSNTKKISNPSPEFEIRSAENQERDAVFASPDQESGSKQNFFSWNINRIRDSFRKESKTRVFPSLAAVVKFKNKAEKVINIQPTGLKDKETLIITNDSPVNVGCCNNLFITLRSKFPAKENVPRTVHYKRF